MRRTEFFGLQCSIWIVGSIAATNPTTKIVLLILAIVYLIAQFATVRNDD